MKKALGTIILTLAALPAMCQEGPRILYNVLYEYYFDNREFAGHEDYTRSQTFHSARLTPMVGVGFNQDGNLHHSVMAGIDLLKNMGEASVMADDRKIENWGLFHEMSLWYNVETKVGRKDLSCFAGMFSRRFSAIGSQDTPDGAFPGRNIPAVFLNDELRFYDNNIEGILMKLSDRRSYAELGLDWKGKYGKNRREQFLIFSYGKFAVTRCLNAGWAAMGHHYANAEMFGGVVDDHTVSPFVELDLATFTSGKLQALSLSLNGIYGYHRERAKGKEYDITHGAEAALDIRSRGIGIHNSLYYGTSQYPYYQVTSPEGTIYGQDLYRGNPFYQAKGIAGSWKDKGFYDRFEAYYQPHVSAFLDLRLAFAFHFAEGGYQGWQQKFSLVFNLDKVLGRRSSRMKSPERHEMIM